MSSSSPLSKIEELKAQIATLQGEAVQELRAKRERLAQELAEVDAQLAELTGEPAGSRRRPAAQRKVVTLDELVARLKKSPDQTLSIRKEGFDLGSIKALAAANPSVLQMGTKGPWPTVTLL